MVVACPIRPSTEEILAVKSALQTTLLLLSIMIATSAAVAGQQAYKLRVDGLACPFCAYGVEKKLGAVKGVQRIEVDIGSGTVTVTMAEGAKLDESAARKAVTEAGFSLQSFEPAK